MQQTILDLSKLDARIPCWTMSNLEHRVCPICGRHNPSAYRRPDGLKVAVCAGCSTLYVSPAPSEKQLLDFYRAYENHSRDQSLIDPRLVLSGSPRSDYRIQRLLCYTDLAGSRVLDVGCGLGTFMYMLSKLGAHVEGIDLSEASLEFAKSRFGLNTVSRQSLLEHEPSQLYDLITFNDVIEHVLQPRPFLVHAKTLLKPGGFIALHTPNGMTKSEVNLVALRVDLEHMHYFTTQTCNFLANDLGIEIKHLECSGYPNLIGIDRPPTPRYRYVRKIRRAASHVKWLHWMWTKAKRFAEAERPEIGSYHLFCIFQKPASGGQVHRPSNDSGGVFSNWGAACPQAVKLDA
jgi:2-polyprenyl-3-methyl-5-hydroxy-6-metoxy-1,4-benzoquinol methylase